MTDLSLKARLDADGTRLVGQLNEAEIKARGLEGALEQAASGAQQLSGAADKVAVSAGSASGQVGRLEAATGQLAASQSTAERATEALGAAQAAASARSGAFGAGLQQAGYQVSDFFVQVGAGTSALRAFSLQGPQFAQALAVMGHGADGSKSKFAAFTSFLSGPWGVALTVAASLVGVFAQKFLEVDDAAGKAEFATSSFSDAQSILGKVVDLTTGKIKDQAAATLALAKAQATAGIIQARKDQADARTSFDDISQYHAKFSAGFGGGLFVTKTRSNTADIVEAFRDGSLSVTEAERGLKSLLDTGLATEKQYLAAAQAVTKFAVAADNEKIYGNLRNALDGDQSALAGFLKPSTNKPKVDHSAERNANFGDSAGERVQRVLASYDPAPRETDKALQDIRSIDRLMAELEKRKPPGFEATIASAQQAKTAIENGLGKPIADIADRFSETPMDVAQAKLALDDLSAIEAKLREAKPPNLDQLLAQLSDARQAVNDSLVRPFQQILTDQRQQNDLLRLAAEGRHEEAAQLQLIHGLMRQVGAESEAQLATELAKRGVTASMLEAMLKNVAIEQKLSDAAQRRVDLQRTYLQEVDRFQGTIETFFADIPQKGIKVLGDFASNVQSQVSDYFARYLTETIFGGVFRQLEAQLTGQSQVMQANKAYVGQIGQVVTALRHLENAAEGAAAAADGSQPIVVTAKREDDPFNFKVKSPRELFGELAESLLKKLGLEHLAKDIGSVIGNALQGAAIGTAANSLLLGSGGNKTGSAIGGALGQIAGEALGKSVGGALGSALGPIGSIAGGVLGGLVGNIFGKRARGAAEVTNTSVYGHTNDDALTQSITQSGNSLQAAISQIAQALGAQVGNYDIGLGRYKEYYQVSSKSGDPALGNSYFWRNSNFDLYDGKDPQAAMAAAIKGALQDGAIQGISAAMQKALLSSSDIDTAIQEALKVKQVENLLGGVSDSVSAELQAFQKTADERLRIAKQYGFDVLAIEKRNAEDRAAIVDKILADRVGSLQQLLDDLNSGDLAEGTLAERRAKLKEQIAQAEQAAKDGQDGAADKLATLSRQLVELSKEAYGTAGGEYSSDRNQVINSAQRIIDLEKERVANAQSEVTDRLDHSIDIANEANDILAGIRAGIDRLGGVAIGGSGGASLGGAINTSRAVLR